MSVSRDDFSIAFRSALLQRGASQKFSILTLIFLALLIFFLDVYGTKFTKPIRNILNDVVYRVSFLASTPNRFFPEFSEKMTGYFNVKKENALLRAEVERFKSLELNVEFLRNENNNLQKILETEKINRTGKIVLGKVLIDKNSPFLKSIIINKGTNSGILRGMPVTYNSYLVGRVVETNYLSSRILLLTDLNSRIPVTLDKSGVQAILSGLGSGNPVLEYLPEGYEILEETDVFASGKDGIFAPGTPIGKTNSEGAVDLFVDSNQLSFVTIDLITQSKENY